jgi:hypothetical protein
VLQAALADGASGLVGVVHGTRCLPMAFSWAWGATAL